MPPQINASGEAPSSIACDAIVVGAFASDDGPQLSEAARELDAALEGRLAEHLTDTNFKAKESSVVVVATLGRLAAKTIAVAGLGRRDEATEASVMRASGTAAHKLRDHSVVASALHSDLEGSVAASAEGYALGTYSFTTYKSDARPSKIERILMLGSPDSAAIERAAATAEATALARDLTNEPADILYPETLADRAREIAERAGLDVEIFDEAELEAKGFGGILGVGRGSPRPPRLIKLHYRPPNAKGRVALVGKGITFDSGGLSLKDAKNMETMKTDMAGGAAVLGAMSALGKLKPNLEVVGLVAAAENMPSGNAIKPGDVIRHYGGVTSEVLNTDAEGRLVLGDLIAYACEHDVDAVVDVATLTGAIMVALGSKATGLFSNDDALRGELEEAAQQAGERVWAMPLWAEYRSDLDSEIADIKNSGPRWGGAILAALFLKEHVADGVAWAHLDIAGPARAEGDYNEIKQGGTGVATRTLLKWIQGRAR